MESIEMSIPEMKSAIEHNSVVATRLVRLVEWNQPRYEATFESAVRGIQMEAYHICGLKNDRDFQSIDKAVLKFMNKHHEEIAEAVSQWLAENGH